MVKYKSALRKEIRARLALLQSLEKESRSLLIADAVKSHLAVSGARVVALYAPLFDEPLLWPLVEELAARMLVLLPKVEGDVMDFYPYEPRYMATGAFGIIEPQGGEAVRPHEIDAIVVPGVAFTESGARMGRGKGFYDRYLSQEEFRGLKIGVCYNEQIVGELPVEPHDVKMDCVVHK